MNPIRISNSFPCSFVRQTSAMHLRPVRMDGKLRLVLLEPPHSCVLGESASNAHANRGSLIHLFEAKNKS